MNKFTNTTIATVVCEMCESPESTIKITITNDSITINDDETIIATYWSNTRGKLIEKAFGEYPSNDDLAKMLIKYEKCDYVMF